MPASPAPAPSVPQPPAVAPEAAVVPAPAGEQRAPTWRPVPRAWRWGIAIYALLAAAGLALAVLLAGGPGSGRLAEAVAVLQQPYLELTGVYRGQDDTSAEVEYVVFESEDPSAQGLRGFLQGRTDIRYRSPGLLPGVSIVHIRRDALRGSLDELNRQPFVHMVLKARVGMICH